MPYQTIEVERQDRVAVIRLARGARGNPVDAALVAELRAASAGLHDDAGIHAIVLTSGGGPFSRGVADSSAGDEADGFRFLETTGQPIVAAIDGEARGAGLELALACDIRIASQTAVFVCDDIEQGRIPSRGGTQRLPRLAGRGIATEMVLGGEPLSAASALRCGLISRLVPAGEADAAAVALAQNIARRGPLAVRYAKECITRGLDMPLEQALRYETDLTVILQTTADRAEGVAAFVEKRQPKFEGR
jgi:enoyl-CoA hydratase/carnithine racemase